MRMGSQSGLCSLRDMSLLVPGAAPKALKERMAPEQEDSLMSLRRDALPLAALSAAAGS